MKKLLTIILTVCLLACAAVPAFAATTDGVITGTSFYNPSTQQIAVTFYFSGEFVNGNFAIEYDETAITLTGATGVAGQNHLAVCNLAEGSISISGITNETGGMFIAYFTLIKPCGTTTVTATPNYFQKNADEAHGDYSAQDIVTEGASVTVSYGTHSYNWTVTKEATHTETGWMNGVCTVCRATAGAPIDTIAHTFGTEWKSDATNHWHECECGEKDAEAAHTMVWVVDKEAAVGVEGSKHEECSVCGYEGATETIPALIDPAPTPDPEDPEEPTSHTGLYIGIGVVLVGLILFFILRKKKNS